MRTGRPQDTVADFHRRIDRTADCWLWTGSVFEDGYGRCRINARTVRVHRLAYELAYGPIPAGLLVCHHCDTPLCVRPDHLFLGTTADNSRDMVEKGRSTRGERNANALLTASVVKQIRDLYRTGRYRQCDLAADFGVKQLTISNVVTRKSWAHVETGM